MNGRLKKSGHKGQNNVNAINNYKTVNIARIYSSLKEALSFAGAHSQKNTKLYQNRPRRNIKLINLHLELHDYWIKYWFMSSLLNFHHWGTDILLAKCPKQCGAWRVGLHDDIHSKGAFLVFVNNSAWQFQAAMHHTTPSYMRGISLRIFYWEAFDSGEFVLLSSPTPGGTVNFPVHLQSPWLDWGLTPGGSKWKNRDRVWGLKKIVKTWLPQYSRLPRY